MPDFAYIKKLALGFLLLFLPVALLPIFLVEDLLAYYLLLGYFVLGIALVMAAYLKRQDVRVESAKAAVIVSWPEEEPPHDAFAKRIVRNLAFIFLAIAFVTLLLVLYYPASKMATLIFGLSLFPLVAAAYIFSMGKAKRQLFSCGFMLCHRALISRGVFIILNGRKNAIYDVSFTDGLLHLSLILRGNKMKASLPVPPEKHEEVNAFILDLHSHFAKEGGQQNG